MTNLLNLGDFTLHSGKRSHYKVDCDSLSDGQLEHLAYWCSDKLRPFSHVIGVPEGGLRFAEALTPYVSNTVKPRILIVDDVYTSGDSIVKYALETQRCWDMDPMDFATNFMGLTIFTRVGFAKMAYWVDAMFQIQGRNTDRDSHIWVKRS